MSDVTLSTDPLPEITAGINLAGDIVKLTATELAYLNSPAMIEARKNVAVQEDRDRARLDAKEALKTGDASKVDADLS